MRKLNNKGMALITAYIFLSFLITLTAGFALSAINELAHARRHRDSTKAFWLAEAGIQKVINQLKNGAIYNLNPTIVDGSLESGDYSVSVALGDDIYTATSTGTVNNLDVGRTLRQVIIIDSASWPSAFDYALFGNGGEMNIKENGDVTGSIFQYGNITLKEDSSVSELTYATGNITGESGSSYTEGELPDPLPTMPTLDTTVYFDPEITYASENGLSGDRTYTALDLTAGTIYVDGNVEISASAIVNGPGTLVATGNVTIKQNALVSEGVTVISGAEFIANEGCTLGSDSMIFASTAIHMSEDGTVDPSGILLTPGNVEIKEGGRYTGVIYAGGSVWIKENSSITGSIVAGATIEIGIEISEYSYITYDRSLFPTYIPPGLETEGGGEEGITVSNWEEIAFTQ